MERERGETGKLVASSHAGRLGTPHMVCRRPHNLSVPNGPAPRQAPAQVLSAGAICNRAFGSPGRRRLLRVRNSDRELLPFPAIRSPVAAIGAFWKTLSLPQRPDPGIAGAPLLLLWGNTRRLWCRGVGSRHRPQPPAPGPEPLLSEELQHRRGGRGGRTGQVETLRFSQVRQPLRGRRHGGETSPSCPS